jgi:hypothetical protein
MPRYPLVISVALLLSSVVLLGVVPATGAAQAGPELEQSQQSWEPWANSTVEVEIQPDGNARWTISATIRLDDQQDVESFQSLASDFEAGQEPAPGLQLAITAAENVDSRTERQMGITEIVRDSTPQSELEPGGTAQLSVEFTWENFARVGDDRLFVDDVLVTTDGELWLQTLQRGQTFIIVGPADYGLQADPGDDGTLESDGSRSGLRWDGPTTFEQSNLEATFIGAAPQQPDDNGTTDDGNSENGESGLSMWWIAIPVLALGLAAVVVAARMADIDVDLPDGGAGAATTDDEAGTDTTAGAAPAEPATEPDDAAADDEVDTELLSDEERVERLLEDNGGRMKQATIVKETDWSDAKVSQLLSTMEDEGRIDKLRIGRENLISFPEEDITEIDE